MRSFITFLFFIISLQSFAQEYHSKIVLHVADTVNIHQKVKEAFIKMDFIVKDIANTDTILTYPRELQSVPGFATAAAVINGNTVTINGIYSKKKVTWLGYQKDSKEYSRILKLKNSKIWPLLERVASYIGGEKTYQ